MEQFTNGASTTLSASAGSADTSISVSSATGFPSTGNFRIMIDSEILCATAVSGTTWTVLRGTEGTTAASHSSGVSVVSILTQAALESLPTFLSDGTEVSSRRVLNWTSGNVSWNNEIQGVSFPSNIAGCGPVALRPAQAQPGQIYFASDNPVSLIWTGSQWAGYNPLGAPFVQACPASQLVQKLSSTTLTLTPWGASGFTVSNALPLTSSAAGGWFVPGNLPNPNSVDIRMAFCFAGDWNRLGIVFIDSTNTGHGYFWSSSNSGILAWQDGSAPYPSLFGITQPNPSFVGLYSGILWLRVVYSGSGYWQGYTSFDGYHWLATTSAPWGNGIVQFGMHFSPNQNSTSPNVAPVAQVYHWSAN